MKRVCIERAAPKKGRSKGRCLVFLRPEHAKKSETPKRQKRLRKQVRNKKTACLRWSESGKRRCLKRAKPEKRT